MAPRIDLENLEIALGLGYDQLDVTVFREETDCLGIVFYRHYLAWFERSREHVISTQFLADLYSETGESFVVTQSEQVFKKSAVYGEELEVRTVPFLDGPYKLHFDQSVWRKSDNTLLVAGFVEMVTVNKEFKLVPVPKAVCDLIGRFEHCKKNFTYCKDKAVVKKPPPLRRKINQDSESEKEQLYTFNYNIHQADTDFTGIAYHPNYYCWFERARTEGLTPELLKLVETHDSALPVIRSAKLQYKNSSRPYRQLQIKTIPKLVPNNEYIVEFDQKLYDLETSQLLVVAVIEIAFIHRDTKQLTKVPPTIMKTIFHVQ